MKNLEFHQLYNMHQKQYFKKHAMLEEYYESNTLTDKEKEMLDATRQELKVQFDREIVELMKKFSK